MALPSRAAIALRISLPFVLAAGAAAAQPLESELQGLLTQHPQIQATAKTAAGTEENITRAFAGFLPVLTLSGDTGTERINSPTQRQLGPDRTYNRHRDTWRVATVQNIYKGGATVAGHGRAIAERDIANLTLDTTRQNALFEGAAAYLNVLRQARLVHLGIGNEANIKRQMHLEDERVRHGSGITVDVLQAKARLQLAKEKRVAFEGGYKDALSRYLQVFGHEPNLPEMQEPRAPLDVLPETLDEVVEIAIKENPIIASAQRQIVVAEKKREGARAGYFPQIDLVLEHNYERNKNAVVGVRNDYSALVKATWELFSGFATQAAVAQASFDYGASQDTSTHSQRKVVETARLAWQALQTARKRMNLLENAMSIANEVFESRKKLREVGKDSLINVLDSENEVYNARINYTAASYDARQAIYQLLLAMGRLNMDMVLPKTDKNPSLALPVLEEIKFDLPPPPVDMPPMPDMTIPIPRQDPAATGQDMPGIEAAPTAPVESGNPFDNPFDAPMPAPARRGRR